MNREIKFRVWDLLNDEFRRDFVVELGGRVFETQSGGREINDYTYQSDFILLQYTGLTDKNDKEIYEGDIIEISNDHWYYDNHVVSCKVFYKDSSFVYGVPEDYRPLDILSMWRVEVIGNIYENPELSEK